jgi:hypothetical protein
MIGHSTINAFFETNFTEDLKKIDILVLVMHGDDRSCRSARRA